mgnify:CR=1 FL=1
MNSAADHATPVKCQVGVGFKSATADCVPTAAIKCDAALDANGFATWWVTTAVADLGADETVTTAAKFYAKTFSYAVTTGHADWPVQFAWSIDNGAQADAESYIGFEADANYMSTCNANALADANPDACK